jgi:hypothetical protein
MKRFLFLMLMGFSFNSFAHDDGGVLGEEASAVDYFIVNCSSDSDRMYFKISSSNTMPLISAQVAKNNFVTNITPSRGGVEVFQTDGNYRITIDKNGVGSVGYSFEYHCENGGEHTETSIVRLQ